LRLEDGKEIQGKRGKVIRGVKEDEVLTYIETITHRIPTFSDL
jgi:cell division septum initiation protein DivIVA